MKTEIPNMYERPLRWMHYRAHTSPHLFWPVVIGLGIPLLEFGVVMPIRRLIYKDHEPVQLTYPLPARERVELTGFDDE
ncbi:uncharacterized protein V1510DRAFT_400525 [Dipodascopsis tothii]|uniref:uncharacterized protein n=1 Tax=Dipodascopsis tothii TaxID=44089 RepID=UPI0034CE5195